MIVEVTGGGGSRPYRGTVNGSPFVGTAGFCRLVAALATPDDGCIEGVGAQKPNGYYGATAGKWRYTQHALVRAVYEGLERPPEGLHAAHGDCHNRQCVNPHHVRFKTPAQNQHDRLRDGTHLSGERHGMAKVTDAERAEIQRLYATGRHTQKEIGQRFGIDDSRVSLIVRPESWRVDPMTPERAALVRFLAWSGAYTGRQIAEACNTTQKQVDNIKHGRTWQPRKAAQ